jgi:hypothetical protein
MKNLFIDMVSSVLLLPDLSGPKISAGDDKYGKATFLWPASSSSSQAASSSSERNPRAQKKIFIAT